MKPGTARAVGVLLALTLVMGAGNLWASWMRSTAASSSKSIPWSRNCA